MASGLIPLLAEARERCGARLGRFEDAASLSQELTVGARANGFDLLARWFARQADAYASARAWTEDPATARLRFTEGPWNPVSPEGERRQLGPPEVRIPSRQPGNGPNS